MSQETTPEVRALITTALEYYGTMTEDMAPHYVWALREIICDIRPEELLPTEVMAALAVLAPAHGRILAARRSAGCQPLLGGPVLRLVRPLDTAADLG